MREIILIKCGEIALKGLNKYSFEDILIKNIKNKLNKLGQFKYSKAQSTIYVEPISDNIDISLTVDKINQIFGISGICRACYAKKDINDIKHITEKYLKTNLTIAKTFKIESKRADKKFPYKSPEICTMVGEYILNQFPNLSVDVHNPDITIKIEVRDFGAYIHSNQLPGIGGMPVGSSGKGLLMISGGIDSPVAGYMMAKRGLSLYNIHFISPPYTSDRAKLKVIELIKKLSKFSGPMPTYIVNFTEFQETIKNKCPYELFTIIMRRYMLKISQEIALKNGCGVLITGESLAQVASQTLQAISCTEAISEMPVFRPLIGMDKVEIIKIAKQIGTFETSILPYEDCCTVFTPKHPKTRPTLALIEKAELNIKNDIPTLMKNIFNSLDILNISEDFSVE